MNKVSPQNGVDIGYFVTGIGIVSLPSVLAVPIAVCFARTVINAIHFLDSNNSSVAV